MNEWVFLSVWVLALVFTCAGMLALLKVRGERRPLALIVTIPLSIVIAIIVIVAPLLLIFMSTDAS